VNLEIARAGLAEFRVWLGPVWRMTHEYRRLAARQYRPMVLERGVPEPACKGLCRHTSLLLQNTLKDIGDPGWVAMGGMMRRNGKLPEMAFEKDPYGEWRVEADGTVWLQHWWLEKDGLRLDLTCESFGWEEVNLSSVGAIGADRYEINPDLCRQKYLNATVRSYLRWVTRPNDFELVTREERAARTGYGDATARLAVAWAAAKLETQDLLDEEEREATNPAAEDDPSP